MSNESHCPPRFWVWLATGLATISCLLNAVTALAQQLGPWPGANHLEVGTGSGASDNTILGLRSDGRITAWGDNGFDVTNVPLPNSGFVSVAAGYMLGLGLKSDRTIVAWGANFMSQANVAPPNADYVAVAAGSDHALGLRANGQIAAWGSYDKGQGVVPEPNTNFVAVAAGNRHSVGLKSDGTIVVWGDNYWGQLNVPEPNTNFVAIAAGYNHSVGLKADGSVVAWGFNTHPGVTAVPPPNSGFVAVAAGTYHSIGLKADGSVVCWGYNDRGQLNVPKPNTNFVAIAAGGLNSAGLKADGAMVVWGVNGSGQTNIPSPNRDFGQRTGIVPPKGGVDGGTTVTILGRNLGNGSQVTNVTLCGIRARILAQDPWRIIVRTDASSSPTNGDVVVSMAGYGDMKVENGFSYFNDLLGWRSIQSPRLRGVPFDVRMALDDLVPNQSSPFSLSAWRPSSGSLLVTECALAYPSFIEIQNVSAQDIPTKGWSVAISAVASNGIDSVNSGIWLLPDQINSGEILFKTENPRANYWGGNMDWEPGTNGWAMILDAQGKVVDFIAWGWSADAIQGAHPTVSGHTVTIGAQFSGNGLTASGEGTIQRLGRRDRNSPADLCWDTISRGATNTSIFLPFDRIGSEIPIETAASNTFTDGTWTGQVTVLEACTGMWLRATCGSATADSAPFDVVADGITIRATAGPHGSVTPGGDVVIPTGSNAFFAVAADPYFHIEHLWTNGMTVGDVGGVSTNFLWETPPGGGTFVAEFGADTAVGGTPLWWMAEHGMTNPLYDVVETNDIDGDGMSSAEEYLADTDPTNAASRLAITRIQNAEDSLSVEWQGGTGVVQYLESSESLIPSGGFWTVVFTNIPPTSPMHSFPSAGDTNQTKYFRLRVVR